jgi:hypothetical protein
MNAPLVIAQAKAVAALPDVAADGTPASRVSALYRRVVARAPDVAELDAAVRFLSGSAGKSRVSQDASPLSPMQQLAQVLLMTNELMFVD